MPRMRVRSSRTTGVAAVVAIEGAVAAGVAVAVGTVVGVSVGIAVGMTVGVIVGCGCGWRHFGCAGTSNRQRITAD